MPNVKKGLSPLKVVKPFSLKLGAQKKGYIYGFGRLSGLVGKPSSTSFGIGPVFGRIPSFGSIYNLTGVRLKRPAPLGRVPPVSILRISNFKVVSTNKL